MKSKLTVPLVSTLIIVSALVVFLLPAPDLSLEVNRIIELSAVGVFFAGGAFLVVLSLLRKAIPRGTPTPYAMQVFFGATDLHIEQFKCASRKEPRS